MKFPSTKRVIAAGAALVACVLITIFVIAYSQKRNAELRTRDWVVRQLRQKFRGDVELGDLRVKVFPRMAVSGEGLSIHYWAAPSAPPLLSVRKFSFDLGFLGIFRVPHYIRRIHLQEMVITIPPRGERKVVAAGVILKIPQVRVGEIEYDDAELLTLPKNRNKEPLDWEIHQLVLHDVGGDSPFAFRGTLTNAKPKGEIATEGQFGPWNSEDPSATPISGNYSFTDADLGPFPGIAGKLSSKGSYGGELDQLEVDGATETPNFSLDNVGKPVPLHTEYSATVDGTNGDTQLHPVHAILGHSVIVATGSIVNLPKQKGHEITLDVTTPKARIEDILQLAINSDQAFLRGPVNIKAKLSLPPGKEKVIDKMSLAGSFAITHGQWTNQEVRDKLQSFSRHAEGKPEDKDAGSAVTDLQGQFVLQNSVITFSQLTFVVPGAGVEIAGTYDLHSQRLQMHGNLKMQAKLSQTVTGAKSFFLKAIDPFFSKGRSGTQLPITITGTRESPVIGVSVFHKKIEKKVGTQSSARQADLKDAEVHVVRRSGEIGLNCQACRARRAATSDSVAFNRSGPFGWR